MAKQTPGLLGSMMWHFRSWEEIKNTSLFTQSNYTMFFMIIGLAIMAIMQTRSKIKAAEKDQRQRLILPAPDFPPVETLENFDWKTTEPVKHRPFKPKYYLTMADATALETMDPNELILMDKNYEDRLQYRKKMLTEHHDIVVSVNNDKRISPAVREMYTYLLGTYLPQRYPTMFKIFEASFESGRAFMMQNLVTKQMLPVNPSKMQTTAELLEILGEQLDEDFLLLLPEQTEKDPKYVLEAYMAICNSGFNPREKLGKRLADIHGPVPGYPQKLEGSMDRFFAKVEVGKFVKRVNWAITTNSDLYAVPEEGRSTTHAQEGEKVEEMDSIDVDNTFLRNERQTLYRLPKSKALVFAFKTYLTPIADIKDEGLGEELAEAIDGLKGGNVPQMHFYKRGAVWGEAVKKYLRS